MFHLEAWLAAVAIMLVAAALTWVVSVIERDVSIVDVLWGILFLLAALAYAAFAPQVGPRAMLVLVLVGAWALRLSAYIAWRNRGQPEDRRYQAIRRRNEPHFAWKSLYLVFGLQALLAWIISTPLLGAIASPVGWTPLDLLGIALAIAGLAIETLADHQLARFKRAPENAGRVMDRGLWRYSRHPNYFGECCFWWGVYLIALAAGAWWSLFGPLLITLLLLRVSGVPLLEKDIGERRPEYAEYVARTNAFIPGPPRVQRAAVNAGAAPR